MFGAIKNWFSPAKESAPESQWDANTVQLQQPNSPAGPTMNEAVSQQPVWSIPSKRLLDTCTNIWQQGPEGMNVHMRGGGEGEDVCCGV